MKWLPIESVPKDKPFLACDAEDYTFIELLSWQGNGNALNYGSGNMNELIHYSHWMPQPEPPGSEPSQYAQAKAIMDEMTDEERLSLMREYCPGCGTKHTPCYCTRDD